MPKKWKLYYTITDPEGVTLRVMHQDDAALDVHLEVGEESRRILVAARLSTHDILITRGGYIK